MKAITTFIRPIKLDDVRAALALAGITELQVGESKSFGVQRTRADHHRSTEYNRNFLPSIRIECLVQPGRVDEIIEAIARAARTGTGDDGRIIVTEAEIVVQIRTGKREEGAGLSSLAGFVMQSGGDRGRKITPEDVAGHDQ